MKQEQTILNGKVDSRLLLLPTTSILYNDRIVQKLLVPNISYLLVTYFKRQSYWLSITAAVSYSRKLQLVTRNTVISMS